MVVGLKAVGKVIVQEVREIEAPGRILDTDHQTHVLKLETFLGKVLREVVGAEEEMIVVDERRVAEHYEVVGGSYELDTALPGGIDQATLIELMGRDKKALDGGLTFVLDGSNGVELVDHVPVDAARRALDAMSRQ